MAPSTAEEQLSFILCCIKHADSGKVDFAAVANECSIVSKGAAAKRYERLLKTNGINPNGGPSIAPLNTTSPIANTSSDAPAVANPKKIKQPATKKRKLSGKGSHVKEEETATTEGIGGSTTSDLVRAGSTNLGNGEG